MSEMKHTPEPWVYRPNEYDDWGFIRSGHGLVAVARDSSIGYNQLDSFRTQRKDPYEPNGKRIVECVNALAGVENPKEYLETILKQREELAEQVKKLTEKLEDARQMVYKLSIR